MKTGKTLAFIITLLIIGNYGISQENNPVEIPSITVRNYYHIKTNVKSPEAFISTTYSDLTGKPISPKIRKSLFRSYNAIGDVKIAEEMTIRLILDNSGNNSNKKGSYIPPKVMLQSNNPLEAVHEIPYLIHKAYLIHEQEIDPIRAIYFINWIKEHAPHAPTGSNNFPDDLYSIKDPNWYINAGEIWEQNFPQEVEECKDYYRALMEIFRVQMGGNGYHEVKEEICQMFNGSPLMPGLDPIGLEIDDNEMRKDIPKFIRTCYLTFFSREPDPYEAYFLNKQISEDQGLSPTLIYFSFLSADEYHYF